jgi:hypothetical protein
MMSATPANPSRCQVTISLSKAIFDALEEVSKDTNLSRTRIYELALQKFADWVEHVHPDTLVHIAMSFGEELGYQRKQSGFRKAERASVAPSAATVRPLDPYAYPTGPGPAKARPRPVGGDWRR